MTDIKINNKTFKLKFGLKVFRILGEAWNIPTLGGVQQHMLTVFSAFSDTISFSQLDFINNIILASIQANPENTETINADDLDDLFLSDTKTMLEIIQTVISEFVKSLPQPETSGKQLAPKKGAAKK